MTDLIDRQQTIDSLKRLPGIGHKALYVIEQLPPAADLGAYQRGYEAGFKEGRTRRKLSEDKDA